DAATPRALRRAKTYTPAFRPEASTRRLPVRMPARLHTTRPVMSRSAKACGSPAALAKVSSALPSGPRRSDQEAAFAAEAAIGDTPVGPAVEARGAYTRWSTLPAAGVFDRIAPVATSIT